MSRDDAPTRGGICVKCTAVGDAHYLTCPTLRPRPAETGGTDGRCQPWAEVTR